MGEEDVLKMQQRKDFLIKFCYWAVIAVCVYVVFKYLLPVLFPFMLAYGIAYMMAKPVRRIAGESKWKRAFFSILLSAVFFMTVGGLAVWLGVWIFSGAKQIIAFLPTVFQDFVFPFLEEGFAWIEPFNAALSAVAGGAATKIPSTFMRTVIMVIATVFLTIDFDKVSGFLLRQIPEKQKAIMQEAKGYFGGTLLKCIAILWIDFSYYFFGTVGGACHDKNPLQGKIKKYKEIIFLYLETETRQAVY